MASQLESLLSDASRHQEDMTRAGRARDTLSVPLGRDTPEALILVITTSHCECGASYRSPQPQVLVRYAKFQNSVHYRRETARAFLALPREIKEHEVTVPFCEACFGGAQMSEASKPPANQPPKYAQCLATGQHPYCPHKALGVECKRCPGATP